MAIIKTLPTNYGINVEYHRITRMMWDRDAGTVEVVLSSYPNAEIRSIPNTQPIGAVAVKLEVEKGRKEAPALSTLYCMIMGLQEFAGSVSHLPPVIAEEL